MSHFKNPESLNSAQGEFSSHVKPSEPLTTKGHAPGVKVGNDAAPEFSAETYPPGTAPTDRSFKPNPVDETSTENSAVPKASDTLGGATSAEVHQGLGHPGSGQTSQELHGTHKKDRSGLTGVGANLTDPQHQQHHDRPYETGKTGKGSSDYPAAEDQLPTSAEQVASERR
ncbi:uncharacterized protein J7T54_000197 [Emericellopsis cladophorae]|uniref:Uncharacterized protein n=1 Tax=Emericellopsis cladophorae TaxID=2686198 RepID=A0A9Q0BC83_9HYPO|nr:uncharacterized protein J7T54_000197 [Emericellopsis cladophorae]KAI6780557.1 hypothetical protein J7T54_000197 [Emericellopsis cladophorae]